MNFLSVNLSGLGFHRVPLLSKLRLATATMPPKRIASTSNSKRKAESSSDEDAHKASKKTKVSASASKFSDQPKNKVLPVDIQFPQRNPGTLRLSTWNIAGLAASQKKGFKNYVEAEDPDILVLTETKVNNIPTDPVLNNRFPYAHWSISDKKTYAGTAVLSKYKPLSVDKTLPGHPNPDEVKGRIITVEFEGCYVVATYVTNAGQNLKTLDAKNVWHEHFTNYVRDLDKKKPVVWMGDMNVAPTEIDLSNAKKNWNKTPGYTKDETEAFKNILNPTESAVQNSRFVDIWRARHPDTQHFTYFSYRFNCREKSLGWRLDMYVLSERLAEKVKMCEIRSEIYGASDHCPVVLEIDSGVLISNGEVPA